MNETLVKYLAGLCDADGHLGLVTAKNKSGRYTMHLRFSLCQSESIDRGGKFINSMPNETGMGNVAAKKFEENPEWSTRNTWRVSLRSDIEKLIPRLAKHMVVKARHWNWALLATRELKGKSLSEDEMLAFKGRYEQSRLDVGPLKPKNHASWAWTCGFLEGDGCFNNRHKGGRWYQRVVVEIHESDKVAVDLLHKSFGGSVYEYNTGCVIWYRNLGIKDSTFAINFLSKLLRYSRLKKHKMETIIHNLRQRLSESTPKGEAIVRTT